MSRLQAVAQLTVDPQARNPTTSGAHARGREVQVLYD